MTIILLEAKNEKIRTFRQDKWSTFLKYTLPQFYPCSQIIETISWSRLNFIVHRLVHHSFIQSIVSHIIHIFYFIHFPPLKMLLSRHLTFSPCSVFRQVFLANHKQPKITTFVNKSMCWHTRHGTRELLMQQTVFSSFTR